ncbi:MAG TPA: FG-GAP-like repeat-containing protein [Bacteroidia bacterium]|jgi:hypothetical protein|nr:FG-GAP-like repeat-containing protein [Bacteroidia bacterium]
MKKNLLFILLLFIGQVNAQICFGTATSFTAGSHPGSIIHADFNGDGNTDVASTNYSSNNISILFGTGTGSFGSATNFSVGTNPCSITSADFNGDGKVDLAVVNRWSNNISILLGSGNGSFGSTTNYTVGTTPFGIVSADFNADGKIDLAVANANSNNVSVLLGTGTGSFGSITNFTVGTGPYSIIEADLNGDGKIDLATANNTSNNISVLLSTGAGSFGTATNFSAGSSPNSLTVADFNGDSKLDLAVGNGVTAFMGSVLLGTGTGGFLAPSSFTIGGPSPSDVVSADFDGDNKADIATTNSTLSVLSGNGSGSFSPTTDFTVSSSPSGVTCADFNNDGKIDFATANPSSGDISILLNCTPTPTCVASVTDSLFNISPLNWGILPHYSSQVTNAIWHWGDGSSTNGLYPSHTYTAAGRYSICAIVYTSCGDSANTCRNDSIYRIANSASMVQVNILQNTSGISFSQTINNPALYPNPATNQITIKSVTELGLIKIFNSLGEISFEMKSKNTIEQINLNELPRGIYIIFVQGKYSKLFKD